MRCFASLLMLLVCASFFALPSALAEEAPVPRLDRIDYQAPQSYVAMGPTVGAGQRTLGIAQQLRGKAAPSVGTLGKIVRWTGRNLRLVRSTPMWRTMDDVVKQGRVASDGDRAYALGALIRAAGMPVIWVKAVSLEGLRKTKAGLSKDAPATRTFLEVFLRGAWRLLDPVNARLYDDYDPRRALLPDGFLAYDKCGNPHAAVLDNRPALFRQQLDRFVAAFDVKRIPWATSRDLLAPWRVAITGQSGGATYAKEAARALGFLVEKRFDNRWAQNLAAVRGKTLIVTSRAGKPVLPAEFRAAWLPKGWQAAYQVAASGGKGWIAHRRKDGTRVVLVLVDDYGSVELAVSEALDG